MNIQDALYFQKVIYLSNLQLQYVCDQLTITSLKSLPKLLLVRKEANTGDLHPAATLIH